MEGQIACGGFNRCQTYPLVSGRYNHMMIQTGMENAPYTKPVLRLSERSMGGVA